MTPVLQTKLYAKDGIHNGNCYAACLASLLNLPLWMVPPFEDMFGRGDWKIRTSEWIARIYSQRLERKEGHPLEELPEFYIANGPAKRGVHHSVIYRAGELAHDPHPSKSGLQEVEWCWFLKPIDQQAENDTALDQNLRSMEQTNAALIKKLIGSVELVRQLYCELWHCAKQLECDVETKGTRWYATSSVGKALSAGQAYIQQNGVD